MLILNQRDQFQIEILSSNGKLMKACNAVDMADFLMYNLQHIR